MRSEIIFVHYVHYTVPPEVVVSATRTTVAVGQSTTFTCSANRTNPDVSSVAWSFTDINDMTTILSETGEMLELLNITEDDIGTYTCNLTNSADLSGTASITIELGGQ